MPLFKGSASPKSFFVYDENDSANLSLTAMLDQLRLYPFVPVDKAKGRYNAHGWVNAESPASPVLDLVYIERYIVLSMRADLTVISASDVKFRTKLRISEECSQRNLARLPKQERADIENDVRDHLRRTTAPKRHLVQLVWDLDNKRLFAQPLNAATEECLKELMEETFGIKLVEEGPLTECVRALGENEGQGFFGTYGREVFVDAFLGWLNNTVSGAETEHMIGVGVEQLGLVFTDRVKVETDGSVMDLKSKDAVHHDAAGLMLDDDTSIVLLAKIMFFLREHSIDVVFDAPKWALSSVKLPKKYEGAMGRHETLGRRLEVLSDLYCARTGLFARFIRETYGLKHAKV